MSARQLRILTLNIHKGFALGPKRLVLSHIREHLRASKANLVFLQEVVGDNQRHRRSQALWPVGTQLEYLADTVWSHHAYGKNAIYQHGHHGNAILSEHPFINWDNIDASFVNFSQRGFLHGTIAGTEAGNIHLICIHLGLLEHERKLQVIRLVDYVRRMIPPEHPLIIAGDLNDWRRTTHSTLKRALGLQEAHEFISGRCAQTFPAFMPFLPMDRIYLRGFDIHECKVLSAGNWREFSDHCALVTDISLPAIAP
jgi:endonuclease/exonuclease/phosphatase family metal-dependent hydrolase